MANLYIVTTKKGLLIRSGPGSQFAQVGSIGYNANCEVFEIKDGWGKVSKTSQRWCSMEFLKKIQTSKTPTKPKEVKKPVVNARVAKTRIMLDPGHVEGYNTGINPAYKEGTKMFHFVDYLKAELTALGFAAFTTRDKISDNPSLTTRGKLAAKMDCDVFISAHTNAAGATACGVSVYRSVARPNSTALGNALGNCITDTINATTKVTKYRGCGIRKNSEGGDYYGVIRNAVLTSKVPYVFILEHGFHTNKKECAYLNDDANLKVLAKAEAKTLYNYFANLK